MSRSSPAQCTVYFDSFVSFSVYERLWRMRVATKMLICVLRTATCFRNVNAHCSARCAPFVCVHTLTRIWPFWVCRSWTAYSDYWFERTLFHSQTWSAVTIICMSTFAILSSPFFLIFIVNNKTLRFHIAISAAKGTLGLVTLARSADKILTEENSSFLSWTQRKELKWNRL